MKAHAREMEFAASSALKWASTHFITKKIWLPKVVYDALPYFYLIAGVAAIVATIYIGAWYWVVPHYVLFGAVCVHIGFLVIRKRQSPAIVERPHRFNS
jgi:hypothetical protein